MMRIELEYAVWLPNVGDSFRAFHDRRRCIFRGEFVQITVLQFTENGVLILCDLCFF
jgi:hypothetical protein